jgi:hypothetical protein
MDFSSHLPFLASSSMRDLCEKSILAILINDFIYASLKVVILSIFVSVTYVGNLYFV